ncbi:NAD(P)-binding domain-containing protein [Planococcus sp. ISL-109]|uniref:ornithine cyclodeaminase family protein n=1 Tax=Planococcus sp. ISL-109 TaxID=2819166 RepID=UPI001BEC4451|nr:NAD(P)-binding domain-containing protein [Planococcus sp. ISL-109]MBT2583871.1 NAD(P)-binding domain-containing protein [Planococcus sp. ISL-109]
MRIINEQQIQETYKMDDAIQDVTKLLLAKHRGQINNPHRTVLDFPDRQASALYMPSADNKAEIAGIKIVTIFPDNPKQHRPTTQGVIVLSDATNGEHVAMMTASYLTRLRTGALSAIATDHLARQDSRTLGVIGTGAMAFEQVLGVLAVRNIEQILLFNRTPEKAARFKEQLEAFGVDVAIHVADSAKTAVESADVIVCATRSVEPVFDGNDLKPGTHINGVGSYLPHMREMDETTIRRADKIVADDIIGVQGEAGELIHAANSGNWSFEELHAELEELVAGERPGRESEEEITFFKCVGAAYFDLAVAKGVYRKAQSRDIGTDVEL